MRGRLNKKKSGRQLSGGDGKETGAHTVEATDGRTDPSKRDVVAAGNGFHARQRKEGAEHVVPNCVTSDLQVGKSTDIKQY